MPMSTDICVPISKLPEAITNTRKLADQYKIDAAIFGHVGDGNDHSILPMDVDDQKEMEKVQQLHDEMVHFALAHDGTCTGEHGIGIGKRKYLYKEHLTSIPMMKAIKHSFDPNGS
ncbi:FAD/FMN-containing dehydrogenase [Oikeobacillus pervagus]|uniref:FAD/FMN-containing dehydrogenase n=1 Tax=Oikeobacillus pervagus TaxID=1325931 RepID=A0AAJ1T7S6_9BACI|nr:FAD-linked oxidase C-terminal domain-containing protein [Oikeobacillus pervagus]MDQ0216140.1 FAD/FMN-containing dehydrogenase [Oikeobacillus pervagus]